jgi:hypothetical protein
MEPGCPYGDDRGIFNRVPFNSQASKLGRFFCLYYLLPFPMSEIGKENIPNWRAKLLMSEVPECSSCNVYGAHVDWLCVTRDGFSLGAVF